MQMAVKTYRARTLSEALRLVRQELGPDAVVLQTRPVGGHLLGRMLGSGGVEVTASPSPPVLPAADAVAPPGEFPDGARLRRPEALTCQAAPDGGAWNYRRKFREDLKQLRSDGQSLVGELCQATTAPLDHLPPAMFQLYSELIHAEVTETEACRLLARIAEKLPDGQWEEVPAMKDRLVELIAEEISVGDPVRVQPGCRRLVAAVGPTGVGKTTTIAKLAAHLRLRERQPVGLITVDSFRLGAAEPLRAYADILDLPLAVVSTPREMRAALARLSEMSVVLVDTAGRDPRDDGQREEIRSLLGELQPDEVHLVLDSARRATQLEKSVQHFAAVGCTALILTKLDETTGLGHLLGVLRLCPLPLSYVTDGQNVPGDIHGAVPHELARAILRSDH